VLQALENWIPMVWPRDIRTLNAVKALRTRQTNVKGPGGVELEGCEWMGQRTMTALFELEEAMTNLRQTPPL
jgi:hypothetical protein